jgi:putative solute:sodium symporter small subunit
MDNEQVTHTRTRYWYRVRRLTACLIALWFCSTFGIIFFARELSGFTLFGWPFSFYMAAQGLTVLYLLIICFYARRMSSLDKMLVNGAADVQ